MQYESAFLISDKAKIAHKLTLLHQKKGRFTVRFGDDSAFITTIMDVYANHNGLAFYHSPRPDLVKKLLSSKTIQFETDYLGAKVSFEADKLIKVAHKGVPAFAIALPKSILWIDARASRRIKLPESMTGSCQFLNKENQLVKLKLQDINSVGFSLLNDNSTLAMQLVPGARFEQATLVLAENQEYPIAFQVRNKHVINRGQPNRTEKVGCSFIQLNDDFKAVVSTLMQQLEQEQDKIKETTSQPEKALPELMQEARTGIFGRFFS